MTLAVGGTFPGLGSSMKEKSRSAPRSTHFSQAKQRKGSECQGRLEPGDRAEVMGTD